MDDQFGAADASSAAAESRDIPVMAGGFELPWVEKYRPILLTDIVGNKPTVERLQIIGKDGNMPNMIIAGPPGTGKTTSILCLARAMLGPGCREAVLEMNASDDRGIDVVRNKIKMFAQKKVSLPPGRQKIVILDEADSMTEAAQQALRRTIELYAASTRFALACNNSDKIIEAIQSRCTVLRYTRLTDMEVLKRLLEVCDAEKVAKTDEGLEAVIFTAQGDMRQALNNLQSTFSGFGLVNGENVFKVCDQPHPLLVKNIIAACLAASIDASYLGMSELWKLGYSPVDIIGTLLRVVKSYEMPEFAKLEFIREIGNTHLRILEGTDSFIQLTALLARLCQQNLPRGSGRTML